MGWGEGARGGGFLRGRPRGRFWTGCCCCCCSCGGEEAEAEGEGWTGAEPKGDWELSGDEDEWDSGGVGGRRKLMGGGDSVLRFAAGEVRARGWSLGERGVMAPSRV